MIMINWQKIQDRYARNSLSFTKTGKEFQISRITDTAIYIALPSGEQSISKSNLERALALIDNGVRINRPADYRRQICDERPAYAWAILRDLGILK